MVLGLTRGFRAGVGFIEWGSFRIVGLPFEVITKPNNSPVTKRGLGGAQPPPSTETWK